MAEQFTLKVLVADASLMYRSVVPKIIKYLANVELLGVVNSLRSLKLRVPELENSLIILDSDILENELFENIEELKNLRCSWLIMSRFKGEKALQNQSYFHKNVMNTLLKTDDLNSNDMVALESNIRDSIEMRIHRILKRKQELSIALLDVDPKKPSYAISKSDKELLGVYTPVTPVIQNTSKLLAPKIKPEFVLIGVSTGGPSALHLILPMLPENFSLPIIIVQHIPAGFSASLADGIDKKARIRIKEAEDGETPVAGTVYIAQGGIHLTLVKSGSIPVLKFNDGAPENSCKPAVDVLYKSAALAYPGKCLSIILTGMGGDGTKGLVELKKNHCFSIVQDEKSCVVYGMPRTAIEAGLADLIVPLDRIVPELCGIINQL